mmetsp:Transcript_36620/g.118298  ORF Transcript_36620/g.118298 Transcript_36620/m.118298 type:complete len:270 (+) Transcript_36620:140-949(+)
MSRQTSIASLAAAGVVLYGSSQVFVPGAPLSSQIQEGQGLALRGTSSVPETVAQPHGSASALGLVGASAVGAVMLGRSGRARASGVARRAEAEVEKPQTFDPAKQLGTTMPLGFFDPLNFTKVGDEDGFRKLRIAEMKHGRVAMMAAVGAIIQPLVHFPGFKDVPSGIEAVLSPPGTYGFIALIVVSGLLELVLWKDDENAMDSIGDFGNPLQLGIGQPWGATVEMRNRELNNGRAAMFAILGIIVAELATGENGIEQLGLNPGDFSFN